MSSVADDDPIQVLTEYRRLYEEHWAVAQSARSLATHVGQADAYERARVLRGEVARLSPQVARHLHTVGIDSAEVSGGMRPAALDRVIALAIERHRQRQAVGLAATAEPERPRTRPRRSALVLLISFVLLSAGGVGWGMLVAGWL